MDFKVIVLDFDGVIVESNHIKHQAFSDLFKDYPEYYDKIMDYHLRHNAVGRYEKFKYIIENILEQKYDMALAEKWANRFSELTRSAIINCPYVEGALDFIQHFSKIYPLYIASATPLEELAIILEERGLLQYFKDFYGAPTLKRAIFEDIARREKIVPNDILYIGDSREDYEVAVDFGCNFLGRMSDYRFDGLNAKTFENMYEIKSDIAQVLKN